MLNAEPSRSRPITQKEYGIPEDEEGMLPWSWVVKRLQSPRNFWLVTVSSRGLPQASPIWGVWMEADFYFGMGAETRKAANLAANPNIVIHLDSSDEVVIVEGRAEEITDHDVQTKIDETYLEKYGTPHGTPIFNLIPAKVFAWDTDYPNSATRWTY